MIAIIGAGISGLTTAYYLEKANIPYILLEAAPRFGGYITTIQKEGYLLEAGANSILCDEATEQFLLEIGLEKELLPAAEVSQSRFIYRNGQYRELAQQPFKLLKSAFFSKKTIFKILSEPFNWSKARPNETLTEFFKRRFGQEIVDYALNPFVAGIYAGNPDNLITEKTFPQLIEMEQKYGSILRGFIKTKAGGRRKSYSFRSGMHTLNVYLATQLQFLRLNHVVKTIQRNKDGSYQLSVQNQEKELSIKATQVVLTVPAFKAADILQNVNPTFAAALKQVNYPPMAVVYTSWEKKNVKQSLNGFGGLHPAVENLYSAGSIWTSSVFPDRCPADKVLFTTFVGGTRFSQLDSEEIILQKVTEELKKLYQIQQDVPSFQHIFLWEKAIPQYDKNILAVYAEAEKAEKDNIFVCANWKDGISLKDCIQKAKTITEKLAQTTFGKC
jgi:oxygen-dependent protoporphyrinogen oxidase